MTREEEVREVREHIVTTSGLPAHFVVHAVPLLHVETEALRRLEEAARRAGDQLAAMLTPAFLDAIKAAEEELEARTLGLPVGEGA